MTAHLNVAYFSMEIAIRPEMPTYSGGLGVLAGDTIRSAADLHVPMLAVTLLHRKGYFQQKLDSSGWQMEEPADWRPEEFLAEMPARVLVKIESRDVHLRAWRYEVTGVTGFTVPVYFLDADLPENSAWDRTLTDSLYGGDSHYRLCQEAILGIGGVRMLRALGYSDLGRFHMNEGHASLLVLELLDEEAGKAGRQSIRHDDLEKVRPKCVFTTHTPVLAGHDKFPMDLVLGVLGRREIYEMKEVFCCEGVLNMTFLGFNLSHYINGVAKKHGEVSGQMFSRYKIDSITNGVHAAHWTARPIQALFDRHIPDWRQDNFSLRYALSIPGPEVWEAHQDVKRELIDYIQQKTSIEMKPDILTVGFGRRATPYKRPDLLFYDTERLKAIASTAGPLQVVYAGKAHPRDQSGKELIQKIYRLRESLGNQVKLVYLENYDSRLGKLMTAGVDLWLNTPEPPLEASGTSGMKAALNGVPSLSVLDGWWVEGHIEGVTGWSIGDSSPAEIDSSPSHASSLYRKLEQIIVPMYHRRQDLYQRVMLHCISLNGSFFNTQRMLQQYVLKAYFQ